MKTVARLPLIAVSPLVLGSRSRPWMAALFAACLLALSASIATARAGTGPAPNVHRPDARIRLACQYVPESEPCSPAWVGDNVYNATAKNQKAFWTDYLTYAVRRDPPVIVFEISIQNDGTQADRFKVAASGVTRGYRVKFLRGTTNITAAVMSGSYTTAQVQPGSAITIKAKVVMPCDSWSDCGQDRADRLVTVRSAGSPSKLDAVKLVRKIWVCTC